MVKSMLKGVFQRAAVAILVMGSLVVPSGICLQQTHKATHKAAHSCCLPASESGKSATTNCCLAHATLPAIVVVSLLPNAVPPVAAHPFVAAISTSSSGALAALALVPPKSPPTGAFSLRI